MPVLSGISSADEAEGAHSVAGLQGARLHGQHCMQQKFRHRPNSLAQALTDACQG